MRTFPLLHKILIVDDDLATIMVMKKMLSNHYEVEHCSDEEAVEKAKEFQPDLILLDLIMVKYNGIEVFQMLAEDEETFMIPVIFTSASIRYSEAPYYFNLGAIGVIQKPFDVTGFHQNVLAIWILFHTSFMTHTKMQFKKVFKGAFCKLKNRLKFKHLTK